MLILLKDPPLFLFQHLLCDNHFFQVLEKMVVSRISMDFGLIRLLIELGIQVIKCSWKYVIINHGICYEEKQE